MVWVLGSQETTAKSYLKTSQRRICIHSQLLASLGRPSSGGKEQISQDGGSQALSSHGSLTPHFVNNEPVTARSFIALHRIIARCSLGPRPPFVLCVYISSTWRTPLLPYHLGQNKHVYSFYSSSYLLPASLLIPCLPWVHQTV